MLVHAMKQISEEVFLGCYREGDIVKKIVHVIISICIHAYVSVKMNEYNKNF